MSGRRTGWLVRRREDERLLGPGQPVWVGLSDGRSNIHRRSCAYSSANGSHASGPKHSERNMDTVGRGGCHRVAEGTEGTTYSQRIPGPAARLRPVGRLVASLS